MQERHDARIVQGEEPFAFLSCLLGSGGGIGNQRGGKSGEVFLLVRQQSEVVGFFQHVLPESELKHGYFAVQFTQHGLLVLRQVGTSAHEVLVGFFQQFGLFLVQTQFVLLVVQGFYTGKQDGVEADVVAVLGEQGRHFAAQGFHFRTCAGTVLSAENGAHLRQQLAAPVQRRNRILKRRLFRIVANSLNLLYLLFHSLQKGRLVMFNLDFLKRRNTVRGGVLRQERVRFRLRLFVGTALRTHTG
ncbi:hypothetical protein Barb4_04549 [Bacteroidales bacterium Barb4]|nr:hypothetical protein Barb4_04549 [Bacteroidales bacterium Barb4]